MRKKKSKLPPLLYFYYHGDLHKKLHIDRGNDLITAWNYPEHKVAKYQYSDVRKNGGKAFTTTQVCEMINRSRDRIFAHMASGNVRPPQKTYGLEPGQSSYAYYWSEDDIMDLHSFFRTVHIGHPRKDGQINTRDLPTASELRAMIRQGTVLYVKVGDEFVPTWQAENF